MTKLQTQIDESIKTAMKEKDALTRDTLRILKGEIEREKGKKELNDVEISKLAKKLIEGIKETNSDNGEVAILEPYVLKPFTEDELRTMVQEFADNCVPKRNLGETMAFFKAHYDGLYDGKMLSTIVREIV